MGRTWSEVTCEVPETMVDLVADRLTGISPQGVTIENLSLDTFTLDDLSDNGPKKVTVYLEDGPDSSAQIAAIESFLAEQASFFNLSPPSLSVRTVQEEDWAHGWKEYFKPTLVGKRTLIKPTWEPYEAVEGEVIIEIDPGMAFGTGTHATTKLCLQVLEDAALSQGPYAGRRKPATVLDVGTGSGILAIGAVKLGLGPVTAVDIDPLAVEVAVENARLNGTLGHCAISDTPLENIAGKFDLLLANILAEDLVRLSAELVARIAPNGLIILSGILTEKEDMVAKAFSACGLFPVETRRDGEWSCLVFAGA